MRYVLADGSGGSIPNQSLSHKVTNAMQEFVDRALNSGQSLQDATFKAAKYLYDQIQVHHNPNLLGYGTFVAAEIQKDTIELCWVGDPVATLWKSGQPFEHSRSAYYLNSKILELKNASQFQIQTFQENKANETYAKEPNNSIFHAHNLDTHHWANVITKEIGKSEKQDINEISKFEISKQQIIDSGAEFLLLMSDGAQPNNMSAMDTNNLYNQAVNQIMLDLHAGRLERVDAAEKIAKASREINHDSDDISVMIIDLRPWKKA
jgi:serine/threonine protein phosphatase PrpC